MKRIIQFLITFALILGAASCKSKREAVEEPAAVAGEAASQWQNVSMPVRVSVIKPQKFAFNGTATLVRGQYVYISFRMLGFEVGSIYLTPDEANLVVKQFSKIWMQEPIGARLEKSGLTFTQLQETMLGNREAFKKLPPQIKAEIGGTESAPEVILRGKLDKTEIEVGLSWDLDAARWNSSSPATFRAPGSDYRKVSLSEAAKIIGGK